MTWSELLPGESVVVTSAATQHVAEGVGIRLLHLKGPSAEAVLGLARTYSDVDVLVHPRDWARFLRGMKQAGFEVPHADRVPARGHSVDLLSPHWGASVDVHHRFPGIEIDAGQAFDLLWSERTLVEVGGRPCATPGRVPHAVILGLHAARSPRGGEKWLEGERAWELLSHQEREQARQLVFRLQAQRAMGTRWGEFAGFVDDDVRRLWEALAQRDTESVWWIGALGGGRPIRALALFVTGLLRYIGQARRRNGSLRGVAADVADKAGRFLGAGVAEVRRHLR